MDKSIIIMNLLILKKILENNNKKKIWILSETIREFEEYGGDNLKV